MSDRGLAPTNARLATGTVIIPGANHIDSASTRLIRTCLRRGGTVVLESGAGFDGFRDHRDQLREYFQILVDPPVELWPARGIPYVDYAWPVNVKVRDFSRAIPLAPQQGTVIAKIGDLSVGIARCVGPGTLVFLGSPLGTALWAGEAEARKWLGALVAVRR